MGLFTWGDEPINEDDKDSKWSIFKSKETIHEEEENGDFTITFGLDFRPKNDGK